MWFMVSLPYACYLNIVKDLFVFISFQVDDLWKAAGYADTASLALAPNNISHQPCVSFAELERLFDDGIFRAQGDACKTRNAPWRVDNCCCFALLADKRKNGKDGNEHQPGND
jgi:hypothetical protein